MLVLYGVMGMFDSSSRWRGALPGTSGGRGKGARFAGDEGEGAFSSVRGRRSIVHRGAAAAHSPHIVHARGEGIGVVFCKYRVYRLLHKAGKRFFVASKPEKEVFVAHCRIKLSFCKFGRAIF